MKSISSIILWLSSINRTSIKKRVKIISSVIRNKYIFIKMIYRPEGIIIKKTIVLIYTQLHIQNTTTRLFKSLSGK